MIFNFFTGMKMSFYFFIFFLLFLMTDEGYAQSSSSPGLNYTNYKNSVRFDMSSNSYLFSFDTRESSIIYNYNLNTGYSLNGIKVSLEGNAFYPSYFGGPCINAPGSSESYYSWSEGIQSKLLKSQKNSDTVVTEWVLYKGSEFYFHYEYRISIKGKTLTIRVTDLGKIKKYPISNYAELSSFHLDRCEDATDPVIIGIPYLSTMNILYSNNFFTSMFFDWTKTNSSQIFPYDQKFSSSSAYYAQYALYNKKTNGKRNKLDETVYLTVSSNLEEVFPNIPNPVAKYKSASVSHLVYDNWDDGFGKALNNVENLQNAGINNLWVIVHNWQNAGYDNKLPDVLPANPQFGGNGDLKNLSIKCKSSGYLFSLHENYSDFYPNANSYKISDVGKDPGNNPIKGWKTEIAQAHLLKPSKVKKYLVPISTNVHKTFKTNASFIDVMTARSPSEYVDYDSKVSGAGKCLTSFNTINSTGEQLRKIHGGPVSAEGYHHFYYIGYYDDFEAQIQTGLISSQANSGGYYKPLLVDFDLRKMHSKTMVHGVGYLERFFYKDSYWKYMGRSKDSVLICSATELAYGHGGFFQSNSYDSKEQGLIEYKYVYPMQLLYGNANAVKILYNDNGNLITISDYIRKYPHTFDKFDSNDFLSQVYIEYDNGVKVFVNRHPRREWSINFTNNDASAWYDCNAKTSLRGNLYTGNEYPGDAVLPISNGWFCYSPVNQ